MAITRIFQSGNSQAVRIPKDLQFVDTGIDVEIERVGNELRIRAVEKRKLAGLMQKFAAFSDDFMEQGRADQEQLEREVL